MNLSPLPIQKFFDNNGRPLNGGLLFTYTAGTTTKIATYRDQAGTLNTNPVVLDYRGEASIWLDPSLSYKFVLAPATDTDPPANPIWTVDNIRSGINLSDLTQAIIGTIFYPRTASEIAAAVTPVSYAYSPDGENALIAFRFFTPTQVQATLLGNLSQDVSALLQSMINFLEGRVAPGTGGKPYCNGGTLRLTGGVFFCGTTSIRVGGNVTFSGNQFEGTQLQWAAGFSGNAITLGPDQSGFYGYSGLYTMGTVVEHLTLQCPTTTACGILTAGIGQNSRISDVRVRGVANIGISITDTFGNIGFKMNDIFIFGAPGAMSATAVGIHLAAQSVIEIDTVSIEGIADTASNRFKRAVEITSGGHVIKNLHFEACQTGIDIDAATGGYAQEIDGLTNTGLICAGCKGVWMHSGFTGSVQGRGLVAGTGGIILANDNTGFSRAGPGVIPFYSSPGTVADFSALENVNVSNIQTVITYVSGGTMTPDAGIAESHLISVTTANPFTIGAPTYNSTAMPGGSLRGKRLIIEIRNNGAGVMGAITWNAVFKLAAWANPANNFNRSIIFEWNTANWVEKSRTTVDIPN